MMLMSANQNWYRFLQLWRLCSDPSHCHLESSPAALVLHAFFAILVQVLRLWCGRARPQIVHNPDTLSLAQKLLACDRRSQRGSVCLARRTWVEGFNSGEDARTSRCKDQVPSINVIGNYQHEEKSKLIVVGGHFDPWL